MKTLILLTISVLCISGFLPTIACTAEEIVQAKADNSYVNNALQEIHNHRMQILESIRKNDITETKRILNLLKNNYEGSGFNTINAMEAIVVSILIGDFAFLDDVELMYERADKMTRGEYSFINDGFVPETVRLLVERKESILKEAVGLNEEKRDFLYLLIETLISQDDQGLIDRNKKANEFLKKYKNSSYEKFIRQWTRFVYVPSKWGTGFCLLLGENFVTSNLDSLLNNKESIGLSIDIYYKRFVIFTAFTGSLGAKAKKPFVVDGRVWPAGTKMDMQFISIEGGYRYNLNKRWSLTPFIGLTQEQFVKADISSGPDFQTPWGYGGTAGVAGEYKIPIKKKTIYNVGNAYWLVRIRTGITRTSFNSDYTRDFGGPVYFLQVGFGGVFKTIERKL